MATEEETYDVVIAGAGVSGLYCAYKLNELKPEKTICVLEKLDRIGGLLKSDLVAINGKTIKQEEGGMRFYKNRETYKLTLDLGLESEIVRFFMGTDNNLNFIRGSRFTQGQAQECKVWFDLYNTGLSEEEEKQYKDPYAILNDVFEKIRIEQNPPEKSPFTPQQWQYARLHWKVNNIELYKWDFEHLLRYRGLSYETIKMIQISLGFKSLFNRNVNAGFGFQSNLDFTSKPEFLTLKNGYDQIPETLCKKITSNGVKVNLQCELVKLDEEAGQPFPIRIEYTDRNNPEKSQHKTIRCKKCVLALSKIALQVLPSSNEWMKNTNFSPYVDSVISESLTKINLYFDNQWWSIFGINCGPNYTDLKLGTVYVFNPIKDPAQRLEANNDPGSLTIYCDFDNSYYWHSMQSIGQDYQPKEHVKVPVNSVLAKETVVTSAMDQLTQLFQKPNFKKGNTRDVTPKEQLITIPNPVLATYTHWTEPRFGDSVHAWKTFSDDSIVSPGVFNVLGPNIGIIGESYSIVQEWVDGSLTHTNSYLEYLTSSKDF